MLALGPRTGIEPQSHKDTKARSQESRGFGAPPRSRRYRTCWVTMLLGSGSVTWCLCVEIPMSVFGLGLESGLASAVMRHTLCGSRFAVAGLRPAHKQADIGQHPSGLSSYLKTEYLTPALPLRLLLSSPNGCKFFVPVRRRQHKRRSLSCYSSISGLGMWSFPRNPQTSETVTHVLIVKRYPRTDPWTSEALPGYSPEYLPPSRQRPSAAVYPLLTMRGNPLELRSA